SLLNNGNGIFGEEDKSAFDIHLSDDTIITVDISAASTLQDVLDAIREASDNRIDATLSVSGSIVITAVDEGIRVVQVTGTEFEQQTVTDTTVTTQTITSQVAQR